MAQTVSRAGKVLALFSESRATVTVPDVVRQVELSRSAAHELLTSMVGVRMLERQSPGHYGLGGLAVRLRDVLISTDELFRASFPVLTDVNARTGESIELVVSDDGGARAVDCVVGSLPVSVELPGVGSIRKSHCTATGKTILAWAAVGRQSCGSGRLKAYTPHTITTTAELAQELEVIRARGVAFDNGEFLEDVCCIAYPILSENGGLLGALGMAMPAHRFTRISSSVHRLLASAARSISCSVDGS